MIHEPYEPTGWRGRREPEPLRRYDEPGRQDDESESPFADEPTDVDGAKP